MYGDIRYQNGISFVIILLWYYYYLLSIIVVLAPFPTLRMWGAVREETIEVVSKILLDYTPHVNKIYQLCCAESITPSMRLSFFLFSFFINHLEQRNFWKK